MPVSRLFAIACFAALTAGVARAESDHTPLEASSAHGSPDPTVSDTISSHGRYSRSGYWTRGEAATTRYGSPPRIEALPQHYPMPREFGQDMHAAIEHAQRTHGGKVLSADRMRSGNREIYRVKLLTPSGRVRVVQWQPPDSSPAPDRREPRGEP